MINKLSALLEGLALSDLEGLPPVRLQRFAALCRHWAQIADPPATPPSPKSGILADLKGGQRAE